METKNNKEINNKDIIKAWRTIMSILCETGYDFMYKDEIDIVAKHLRISLGIEKPNQS